MQGPRPFLVHGVWKHSAATARVTNPFTGNVIAEVCQAGESDAEEAMASSVAAAPVMAKLASHARYNILQDMAALLYRRRDEFAQTITAEAGKPIADAKREVNRAMQGVKGERPCEDQREEEVKQGGRGGAQDGGPSAARVHQITTCAERS